MPIDPPYIQLIYEEPNNPLVPPPFIGARHYNTLSRKSFEAIGTSSVSDWIRGTIEEVVNFDVSTPNNHLLFTGDPGDSLLCIEIVIDVPFNGTTSMTLGTVLQPSIIVESTDINLHRVGTYRFGYRYNFTTQETMRLFLSVGTATVGSGKIYIKRKKTKKRKK